MSDHLASASLRADVVVIGGGIGGLSAAIRLAARGRKVIVLEQKQSVGGKMGEIRADGFRWDTGPSVITMRPVLEDLFAAAGRRLEDYVELIPVEPLTRYFYADGAVLDASHDPALMQERVAALAPADADGYQRYLRHAADLHRITGPVFIYGPQPTWRSFLQVPVAEAVRVDAWRSLDASVRRYVRSPHLRQMLGRFATYAGSDPYQASATLGVIADVELSGGVFYPRGGIYEIARGLARLAAELGVDIRTGCRVAEILVEKGVARGVRLTDGERVAAASVVANVDVATVYRHLLPPESGPERRRQQAARYEASCSGFVLLLGVEGEHPGLAHHNIFFSSDYRREFEQIFKQGVPAAEPTIYVAITAKSDPDQAPPGHENWFVLVNAPAVGPHFDWATQAEDYRQLVLARLAQFGYDIRARIRSQRTLTPADLAADTGAWQGALYGMSLNSSLAPFRRPSNRCRDVAGLYFAGGTTHPGGGVPMVMLSARLVADMITISNP